MPYYRSSGVLLVEIQTPSFVVGGREIDLKMSNVNEFGQFKAQTSAKVLLRP